MEQMLTGYLLNALTEREKSEVEEYLAQHPEARATLAHLQAVIAPLAADNEAPVPRPGLAVRTLAKVAEHICADKNPRANSAQRDQAQADKRQEQTAADHQSTRRHIGAADEGVGARRRRLGNSLGGFLSAQMCSATFASVRTAKPGRGTGASLSAAQGRNSPLEGARASRALRDVAPGIPRLRSFRARSSIQQVSVSICSMVQLGLGDFQ